MKTNCCKPDHVDTMGRVVNQMIFLIFTLFQLCSCQVRSELHTVNMDPPETNTVAETPLVMGHVPDSESCFHEMILPKPIKSEADTQETEIVVWTEAVLLETEHQISETLHKTESVASELMEPPVLPSKLHTNITSPEAVFILAEIYDMVSEYENVSIYFMDVNGDYWFGIEEETQYHTASTIKPIYCQYILSTGIDMDTEIKLQNVSRTSATGKLTWDYLGCMFTVGELIEYSLRYSDNQAYRLLYETFGIEGYNCYISALGSGGLGLDEEWEWSRVTPKKLSLAMQEIYWYNMSDDTIITHLKNTDYNVQIPAGTQYETAHKYGSNGGSDGYHDTAIVYAPECPYILTILTGIDTTDKDDENMVFRNVATMCDKLHSILFE